MSPGPFLFDPAEGDGSKWFPANLETQLLLGAVLTCKDLVRLASTLDSTAPGRDRHGLAMLSTQVVTLVDCVLALQRLLANLDHSGWPEADRKLFTQVARELRKKWANQKTVRNKRGAHFDPDAFSVMELADPGATVIPTLGRTLVVLVLCFNHDGVYKWTRTGNEEGELHVLGDAQADGRSLPIAARVRISAANEVEALLGATVCVDPRQHAQKFVWQAIDIYNRLVIDIGTPGARISLTPYR